MRAKLLGIIALLCVGVSPAASQAPSFKPSFNCKTATQADERTICANSELSRLDNVAAAMYNDVRRRYGDQFAKSINTPLFQARRACATDVDCIKAQQNAQIKIFVALGQSRVYISPDEKLHALVYPVDLDVHQWENRVVVSTSDGKLLTTKDHSSEGGGHGNYVETAKWSPDSQFFVYTMSSSGGHHPWYFPMEVYSRQKNIFASDDVVIGDKPVLSKDFKFTGPHTVLVTISATAGLDKEVPTAVDLEEAIKKIAPSSH